MSLLKGIFFCALVAGSWLTPAAAPAQPADGGAGVREAASPPRADVALLFFVSAYDAEAPSMRATQLRWAGGAALASALERRGLTVCQGLEIQQLMQRRRVRTDLSLSAAFFRDVREHCGAKRLVIGKLRIFPDRFFISARIVDASSGRLLWIDLHETPLEGISPAAMSREAWIAALREGSDALTARKRPVVRPGERAGLYFLPVAGVAVGEGQADLFNDCLMRELLASGRWWIPDPALVVTYLQTRGMAPEPMSLAAMDLLGKALPGAPVLLAELIGYDEARRPGGNQRFDETGERYHPTFGYPHFCSLRLVDTDSGSISHAGDTYKDALNLRGLFGIQKQSLWLDRFDELASRLLEFIPSHPEVP